MNKKITAIQKSKLRLLKSLWRLTFCKFWKVKKSPRALQTVQIVIKFKYVNQVKKMQNSKQLVIYFYVHVQLGERTKSPLGQNPTRTKAHRTISHGTKAHCLIWQGGHKPTFLKENRVMSFIKLLTLIRQLLQGKSHLQCVFTDIIICICCDKQLNLGVKSHWYVKNINSQFGSSIYCNWETYCKRGKYV